MKYLIEASTDIKLILLIMMGVILIKLISNPIHAVSHEEAEAAIKVPITREGAKINVLDLNKIKKKRFSINGV